MGRFAPCFGVLFLVSCTLAKVEVNVVGERTALENQVLGTYNSLDDEMLLATSVRAVDPEGRLRREPLKSPEQRDAVEALQTLAFHEDDVAAFKRLGWVGEDNQGRLAAFGVTRDRAPDDLGDFATVYKEGEYRAVVAAVNQAREVVMRRVIELNETFTKEDLPRVRRVFAQLNSQNALPGERVQGADGAWGVRP